MFRSKVFAIFSFFVFGWGALGGAPAFAQTAVQSQTPPAATAPSPVPALVPYSGVLVDAAGKPLSGEASITFLIFKDQQGGEPLWAETQTVRLGTSGHYKVELGASNASGLPQDLFSTGEARWLEVQAVGQAAQARVLLASVPYSMKAGDSAMLGGMPASAFMLADDLKSAAANLASTMPLTTQAAASTGTITAVIAGKDLTGGGKTGSVTLNVDTTKVPQLATANTFAASQTIDGNLTATGTVSAAFGVFTGSVATASVYLPVTSSAATGVIDMGGKPFVHAAGGTTDVFAGVGAGNIGNTAQFNAALGSSALAANTASPANTAVGANALPADTAGYNTAVGFSSLEQNTSGSSNTAIGTLSGGGNISGVYNTFVGIGAGAENVSGSNDTFVGASAGPTQNNFSNATAVGYEALVGQSNALVLGGTGANAVDVGIGTQTPAYPLTLAADDNGSARAGVPHQFMIQGVTLPQQQLLIGYNTANGESLGFGAIQATYQDVANTPLALNPGGGAVLVGLSQTGYSNPFQIGQGQGAGLADGWATYSSRRFKTDIRTLTGALDKVERMRGVSYTLKATGRHEIGVIAEEVGEVVPEAVTFEKNGKDAQSVDYNRLTAVLIEAVKEQQAEIAKQSQALKSAMQQLRVEQAQMRKQAVRIRALQRQVNASSQAQNVAVDADKTDKSAGKHELVAQK